MEQGTLYFGRSLTSTTLLSTRWPLISKIGVATRDLQDTCHFALDQSLKNTEFRTPICTSETLVIRFTATMVSRFRHSMLTMTIEMEILLREAVPVCTKVVGGMETATILISTDGILEDLTEVLRMESIGTLGLVTIILFGKPECVSDLYKVALIKLPPTPTFRLIESKKLKRGGLTQRNLSTAQ